MVFHLEPTSPLVGEPLEGFDDDEAPLSYRTVAITRGGQTIIRAAANSSWRAMRSMSSPARMP